MTSDEREHRLLNVRGVLASAALEGRLVTDDIAAAMQRYADGDWTLPALLGYVEAKDGRRLRVPPRRSRTLRLRR